MATSQNSLDDSDANRMLMLMLSKKEPYKLLLPLLYSLNTDGGHKEI